MSPTTTRRALILSLALSLVLAIGFAIAPSFADFPPGSSWEGNCPAFYLLDTSGYTPNGSCLESNAAAGLCRRCAVFNVLGNPAKGDCVTFPL